MQQIGAVIEKPDVCKYLSADENLKLFAKLSGVKPSNKMLMDQLGSALLWYTILH
ncbi:MAG TPA: hypothetical protein PLC18_09215 [Sediminibacterium sp.]|uniref:hypothetical protein n=1 Tax=Sediminibacterium sp. TaxID=1917865 RepID=UPI002C9B3891|nr:hypothetical protein [Sediminibacterium sp.]HQS24176.1 hypothetical protein [Sediminibacterium sp.]HQS35584.1 hypothetical protein [Sediminibacterium sp.]